MAFTDDDIASDVGGYGSSLSGFGDESRRGGRSVQGGMAQAAGLETRGVAETAANIREWGALSVYITAFTARAVAKRVLATAKKHVPFDTGELYDSGYVEQVAGASLGQTVIKENVEGTDEYVQTITGLQGSFSRMDYFGTAQRTFTKYVAGFSAPHAAVVHENPLGFEFHQPPVSQSGRGMPPGSPKMDHFLLFAYNQHSNDFSQTMIANLAALKASWEAKKLGEKTAEQKGMGLVSRPGAPRLVRR